MFSNNQKQKNKDELLRLAFLKIKQENSLLNEKMIFLQKRIESLERQKEFEKIIEKKESLKQQVKNMESSNQVLEKVEAPKQAIKTTVKLNDELNEIEKIKASLTPSEREILHLFTMSKDKSYTYDEVSKLLKKSPHTIKAQVQSLIKKGINLSFKQLDNHQRSYYLDNEMFEMIIKAKN